MHKKNKHQLGYNISVLCEAYPELSEFVFKNNFETKTIDFANAKAVKALNTALLFHHYNIQFWDFPDKNLCPPIPGRVDYMHYAADLLNAGKINSLVKVLDIGTGATCVYPILGHAEYNWTFVGSDIDKKSLDNAQRIITKNKLEHAITLRFQEDASCILNGIIKEDDRFDLIVCNPPFYKSEAEAIEANARKIKGLNLEGFQNSRNFSGTPKELWYKGGEKAFLHNYLYESSLFKKQCNWFTSLVSKTDLVKGMYTSLRKLGVTKIKTVPMGQGNKISRMVAWSFQ